MSLYVRIVCVVTSIAVLVAPNVVGQQSETAFRGETSVNVIEVPVRVVDTKTGEPVVGLTADDFEIFENGERQQISNFAELWRSDLDAVEEGGMDAAAVADGSQEIRTRSVELVYFVDLFLMNKEGRDRAVEGLRSAYAEGFPDGQYVSLVVYDGSLETLVDRSDDREEILEALEELEYVKPRGNQQTIAFTEELIDTQVSGERDQAFYERRFRHRDFIGELEKRIMRVGNAVVATMSRYASVDGRRVLIAFTPGHPRTNWAPEYSAVDYVNLAVEYPVHDLWSDVADQAADLGFTFFTVDSSGVQGGFPSDVSQGVTDSLPELFDQGAAFRARDSNDVEPVTDSDPNFAFDAGGETRSLGSWLEQTRKSMMILATTSTGGDAFFVSKVEPTVASLNHELGHHYSVAYVADHSGDGKTYDIEVRLPNRPELRVDFRTSYVDQPAAVRSGTRLRSAMLFGDDANPLGIRVDIGDADSKFRLGAAGSKRVTIPLHIKIPYGRLEMIQRGDIYWSRLWITLFAEDEAGNQSALASHEQPVTVDADRHQQAVAKGYFSYHTGVEIEGGVQQVFVGIQEELSGRTSIVPIEFDF